MDEFGKVSDWYVFKFCKGIIHYAMNGPFQATNKFLVLMFGACVCQRDMSIKPDVTNTTFKVDSVCNSSFSLTL